MLGTRVTTKPSLKFFSSSAPLVLSLFLFLSITQHPNTKSMSTLSNCSARSKKKMKESEFNNEDRISKLPEDLLHHIFSFLDMKFVIQTSILSKKWRYFWISQPIMNFDQELYHPRYDIKKKISRALSLNAKWISRTW